MATTMAGDTLSEVYQIITEGLASVYEKRVALIMLEELDPRDIDGTTPAFVARMIIEAAAMSASYATISRNYMNAFFDAEEGNGTFNKAGVNLITPAFDRVSFSKRMIASVNYGYKRRLSKAGVPMRSLPMNNVYFQQTVKETTREATQRILQPGRDSIVKTAEASEKVVYGYGRKANSDACDFCMMLTGRKNYRKETYEFKSHNNCKCTGEPITSPDWEPSPEALKGYEDFLVRQRELDNKYGAKQRKAVRVLSREERDVMNGKLSQAELDVRNKERWVKNKRAEVERAKESGKMDSERYENIQKSLREKEFSNTATRNKIRADKDFAAGKITDEERANIKELADIREAQKKAAYKPKGSGGLISKKDAKSAILGG